MADDEGKGQGANGAGDKGGTPGQGADEGAGKLEQFLEKLDTMASSVEQLGQKVNLIQQNMLSPEYLDKGEKGKKPEAKKPDEGKAKGFNDIPWDELTNKELAMEIVAELNETLKGVASRESMDKMLEKVTDLATDIDVAATIVDISREEDCSVKEAHKKFWDLADDMEKLTEKFPDISAGDAYKIAAGKMAKPKPEGDKDKEPSRKEKIKELASELRGGGAKPGGPGDLGAKPPADTRSAVTKKYEELFEGK